MQRICAFSVLAIAVGCGGSVPAKDTPPAASARPARRSDLASGRQKFLIVPQESKASFIADEEFFPGALKKLGITAGKRKVVGTTQSIEGRFEFDPQQPDVTPGDNVFTVRINTLATDQSRRDKYIREDGPRLNDYPAATFKATSLTKAGEAVSGDAPLHLKLAGNMIIRDITKPVVFDVQATVIGDTLTGKATTRLLMSDFGIEPLDFYNTLVVADEIGIEVQFTARPPDPGGRR